MSTAVPLEHASLPKVREWRNVDLQMPRELSVKILQALFTDPAG